MNLSIIIGLTITEPLIEGPTIEEQPNERAEYIDPDGLYTRTYSSLSGADMVFYCNGEAFGEAQSYSIDETTNALSVEFAVFEIDRINDYIELLNGQRRALVFYMNEYGNGMYVVIEGISFRGRSFRHGVDDVVTAITAHYGFDTIHIFPGRPSEAYSDILPNNFFT